MQSLDRDDLDWLAFRYVSNEMTGAEIESFEQRLADDQSAREAVARAVDVSQAVSATRNDVIPIPSDHSPLTNLRSPVRRVRQIRWIAAAAASLAAGVLLYHTFRGSSDLSSLAKVWAKHFRQEAIDMPDAGLLADSEDAMAIDEDDDLTVPAWMIEAVGASDSDKWEDS